MQGPNAWPERFILVADELSATTLAELPQDRLAGVVVRDGAANSHAAIMVRALGIPTVMAQISSFGIAPAYSGSGRLSR